MFIWFVFRDSTGNPWQSGLEVASGAHKPAYNTFSAIARLTDGQTVAVAANKAPRLKVYLPFLAYYNPAGAQIGVYYTVYDGTKIVARGTPTAILGTDQGVSFTPAFTPVKKHAYSVVVVANEQNGHTETRTTAVTVK